MWVIAACSATEATFLAKRYLLAHRKTILVFVQTHFGIVFLCYYSIAMVCFSSNVTVILNFDLCATSTSNSSKVCYQTTPCVSIDSSVNTITGTKQQKKLPCCCLQNNLIILIKTFSNNTFKFLKKGIKYKNNSFLIQVLSFQLRENVLKAIFS